MPKLRVPDPDGDLCYDVCYQCHTDICDDPDELLNLPHKGSAERDILLEASITELFSWDQGVNPKTGDCCDVCGSLIQKSIKDWSGDRHAC